MAGDSELFQRVLAAALQLSTVDKLRLIARIADSLADELEKSQSILTEISWQGLIDENHRLTVQMPDGFPPCRVTVRVTWPSEIELKDASADQLRITIQPPDTEAVRQWFADYQRKQGMGQ